MLVAYISGGLSLMLLIMGAPLLLKKVRPNSYYGFRNRKTLSNETIWYAANFRAGLLAVLSALCFGVTAWISFALELSNKTAGWLSLIPVSVFTLGVLLNYIWLERIPRVSQS